MPMLPRLGRSLVPCMSSTIIDKSEWPIFRMKKMIHYVVLNGWDIRAYELAENIGFISNMAIYEDANGLASGCRKALATSNGKAASSELSYLIVNIYSIVVKTTNLGRLRSPLQ